MDLNRFRTQLTNDRDRLLTAQKVLEEEQGTSVDGRRTIDADDASPQDPAEIGEQFSGRREVLDELDHLDAELAAVTAALDRLDAGTYGRCMDCGQPIDEERLVARPTARRCTADQRRFEAGGTGLSRR